MPIYTPRKCPNCKSKKIHLRFFGGMRKYGDEIEHGWYCSNCHCRFDVIYRYYFHRKIIDPEFSGDKQ